MPPAPTLSNHARRRMQQRGISRSMLDAVLTYGAEVRRDSTSTTVALRRETVRELRHILPQDRQKVDKLARVAAVVAKPGPLIITVMLRKKPPRVRALHVRGIHHAR